MVTEPNRPRVILALDYASGDEALRLVDRIGQQCAYYKVGLELFSREGPSVLRGLAARSKRIFLDLKLFDIPNTVHGAVRAAAEEGVELLTVHAAGGREMLKRAVDAARGESRILAVTVLTSLNSMDVESIWGRPVPSLQEEVLRLAETARDCGADGVVASPLETMAIKKRCGSGFLVVNPGIRLPGDSPDDQARVTTPLEAARAGADYLVVGRAVTRALDPVGALGAVYENLSASGTGELI